MDTNLIKNISKCNLFKNIKTEDIPHLLHCFNSKVNEYKKDEYIAIGGTKFTGVGLVIEGTVSITKENFHGDKTIVTILKEGNTFGEIVAFTGDDIWPASVLAQNNCKILFFHPEKILGTCNNSCVFHKTLIANIIRIIATKTKILNEKVEYLTTKTIRGKISKYLLAQYKQNKDTVLTLSLNREELADFLNITRPSLSRELCNMRDEGLIDFQKKTIKINDIDSLIDYVE